VQPTACIQVINGGKGKGKGANGKGDMAAADDGLDADSSEEGKGRSSTPKTEKSDQGFAMGKAGYSESESYRISPRHSNRHQFYYYGQEQLVSTRGVGHGGRPSATPTRSPLAECVIPESQPEKIVKPPSDSKGPKLVQGPVIKLPKPETDDHGPKLQKAPSSGESGKGKGKGRPNPYKTTPTFVPAIEPNRTYAKVKSHPPMDTQVVFKKAPSSRVKGVGVGHDMPSPPKPHAGWPSMMPMLDKAVPGPTTPRPIDSGKGKGATDKSDPVLTRPPTTSSSSSFGVLGESSEEKVQDPKRDKEENVGFGIVDGDNSDYNNPEEDEESDQSTMPGKMAKKGGRRTLRKLEW
jgi:hypothetical protein